MFCKFCGANVSEDTRFCPQCGQVLDAQGFNMQNASVQNVPTQPFGQQTKKLPKCTHCGYVGEWKKAPILRPIDFVIGIPLCLFGFIPGLIYIGVVAVIRMNPDNREKICPQCNAKNLWTFMY